MGSARVSEFVVGEMVSRKWLGVSWFVIVLLVGCATAVSAPTLTPETIAITPTSTATTWVATVAEGFEMIEVENPSDFIEEEVINADKTYRAIFYRTVELRREGGK